MICRHWREIPKCFESKPSCAFSTDGYFKSNNWNCKLMNKLRGYFDVHGLTIFHNDENLSVVNFGECDFAILVWYKSRGQTEGFWICDGTMMRKGTEQDALKILRTKVKI